MKTKVCPKCKVEKPLTGFHKNKARKSGTDSHCRVCVNEKKKLNTKNMTDGYIVKLLNSEGMKASDYPKELIEVKRVLLKTLRKIREIEGGKVL